MPAAWYIVPACYLLGCVNAAYYLVRLRTGQDIRSTGTGTAGARNAGRLLGRRGFILTFALDAAKGALAVGIAALASLGSVGTVLAMLAVVVGHVWPVQLRFRGGKGLATAAGATLAFDYRVLLGALVVAVLVLALTRHFTLAGMAGVALAPVIAGMLSHPLVVVGGVAAVALIVLTAHRTNLRTAPGDIRKRRLAAPP